MYNLLFWNEVDQAHQSWTLRRHQRRGLHLAKADQHGLQALLSCECKSRQWILPEIWWSISSLLWKPAEKNGHAPNHFWWTTKKRRFQNSEFRRKASARCWLVPQCNLCSGSRASNLWTRIYAIIWIERKKRAQIYAGCWRTRLYVGFPKCYIQIDWSWQRFNSSARRQSLENSIYFQKFEISASRARWELSSSNERQSILEESQIDVKRWKCRK